MSYRFYVVMLDDGTVYGTDDEDKAYEYSYSEEAWVVDTKKNEWVIEGAGQNVGEMP